MRRRSRLEFRLQAAGREDRVNAELQTAPGASTATLQAGPPVRQRTIWETGLRWLAGIVAVLAAGQTALHLVTPHLAVTPRTWAIARKHLVAPKARSDFHFLAQNSVWSGKRLKTLLQHVELANYNRGLVNWQLDDADYRDFVLSPQIDPAFDEDMAWRRTLWESLYPRIRKESAPEVAAEVVVRHLCERVTVVEGFTSPKTIADIWRRQITDGRGFEALYVAALRSTGIAAKLDPVGQAELRGGGKWQPAPHSLPGGW